MKVLIVGNGGREATLAWKLIQSQRVTEIFIAPGNAGTALLGTNIPIKATETDKLIKFAKANKIDLTVVGPEAPLVIGIVDEFNKAGLRIFGPTRAAAQLEGSKAFAKNIMSECNVPTAACEIFHDNTFDQAIKYTIDHFNNYSDKKIVIKADGLASGKGVFICDNLSQAQEILKNLMLDNAFKGAGKTVVIEDYLEGTELSVMAFCDGKNLRLMLPSQDHKQRYSGDLGPMTGGMGAFAPVGWVTTEMLDQIKNEIFLPLITGLKKNHGIIYQGILYAGLMYVNGKFYILEWNVRMGDPETQAVLALLESDLLEYFQRLGVEFSLERGGRYYPSSGKAESVVHALLGRVEELKIPILTGIHVSRVRYRKKGQFEISLSERAPGKQAGLIRNISSDFLVIATGGRSYPATGSDGSGYTLAEGLGHSIVPPIPALVPLKTTGSIPKMLNNLTLKNCRVDVYRGKKKVADRFGDVEFRDNEAAGPVLLKLSENIVRMIGRGDEVSVGIDMKPALDHGKLDKRILRETSGKSNRSYADILKRLVPRKVGDMYLQMTGADPLKRPEYITREERKELVGFLKDLRFGIKGSAPFSKALVTSGGVLLKEIDHKTMESKLIPGLYFAGEILDLNGDTGGYNLQAAFSTGWLAGRSIKIKHIERGG